MPVHKYKAFISYSHADRRVANWLHQTLETYRVPRKLVGQKTEVGSVPARLTPIFRDRDELPAAGELGVELCKALDQSEFLIVIASVASAQSRWVNEEIRQYKSVHGESRVLVVIVDGEPGSDNERECFPLAVRRRLNEQGEISDEPAEPLAVDLRSDGDGKRLAKLKLIAGLTGLPLDQLVKRDEVRRQRTLIGYAAATSVIAICMSVLAVMAVRGQIEAEQQRAESDGLVEFMLTDLRMQLEPVGRLEIFDSVGQRALAYFANQDIDSLDADSLGRRARALHLVGEVRDLQADTEGALVAFEQAQQTTAELLARDPMNVSRIYDHSQSTFWVGYIAWQRGDMEIAEERFREYNLLATQLVEIEPLNPEWRKEQAHSLINLGVMLHTENRNEEAIDLFRNSLEIRNQLVKSNPEDRELKWSVAQGHAWLSDAMKAEGDLLAAMSERRKEQEVYAEILTIDNRDARALEGSSIAYFQIADLSILKGQYIPALEAAQSGLEQIEQLVSEDPSNSFWQDTAVSVSNKTVEALMLTGQWNLAYILNQTALQRAQSMVEADPTVIARITKGLMTARWMQTAISFALQDHKLGREQLFRFEQEFGQNTSFSKQDADVPWSMVYAMNAVDRHAAGDIEATSEFIESINNLNPIRPRALAALEFLINISTKTPLSEERVVQADGIAYNPALILQPHKETTQ